MLDDIPRREILGAAPFHFDGAVLHCRTKLAFQFRESIFDCGPTLIDQLLGLLAVREVKRRTELGRGNADHPGAETLRQLTGNFQPRLVGLAERQADHYRRIFHRCLQTPACVDL